MVTSLAGTVVPFVIESTPIASCDRRVSVEAWRTLLEASTSTPTAWRMGITVSRIPMLERRTMSVARRITILWARQTRTVGRIV